MNFSEQARELLLRGRCEPFFLADWRDVVFLHFAVRAEVLQPFVPFPLDLHEGMAYVSCVAFTMKRMRPRRGGATTALPFKPIATHDFLNVRTYVKRGEERGIYFLAEWLPNRLAVALGPTVFGLPYRHGHTSYDNATAQAVRGRVVDAASGKALRYTSASNDAPMVVDAALTEFLLERYTAFTDFHGLHRCFRIWHQPWTAQAINVCVQDAELLAETGDWCHAATFVGAHHTHGFDDVGMGRPRYLGIKTFHL